MKNKYSEYFIILEGHRENRFFNLMCNVMADLLAGFLFLFTKCSMNMDKNNIILKRKKSKHECKLLYSDTIKEKNKRSRGLLILISFLHLFSLSAHFLFFLFINVKENEKSVLIEEHQMDWLIAIDIISRHIFSRLILKTNLYKHHIWSLYICMPGFLFMTITDILSIIFGNKEIKIIYYILLISSRAILFPLKMYLIKNY